MTSFFFSLVARPAVWVATLVLVVQPQLAIAQLAVPTDPVQPMRVVDVELADNGVLRGQIVGSQGQKLPVLQVLISNGHQQQSAYTDEYGNFAVQGLMGTVYQVQVGEHVQMVRAWAPGTAPPKAVDGLLIVPDDSAVLGQNCGDEVCGCGSGVCGGKRSLARPLILGSIIAAAIAIPIAVDNSDDGPVSP